MNITQEILSDIVVYNKYAKYLPKKQRRETWKELVTRNKKMHQAKFPKLKSEIEDVYELVYNKIPLKDLSKSTYDKMTSMQKKQILKTISNNFF